MRPGMGETVISSAASRPDLYAAADELTADIWPTYNIHGDVLSRYWPRLGADFAEFQFVLHDADTEEILGQGNAVPCVWDGTLAGLPEGIDAVVASAFAQPPWNARGPNVLSALAVEVPRAHQGRGISRQVLAAIKSVAAHHGFDTVIVPVRPVLKDRYPLTPIERYLRWLRPDGLPFDPWLRVHVHMGGEALKGAPHSLAITAPVAAWESWTDMAFPDSGEYVIPQGLATVAIDREADTGRYYEPNIWVRHAV